MTVEMASLKAELSPEAASGSNLSGQRYQRYLQFVDRQRRSAEAGNLKLAPDGLWLSITENCNFKCVGCYTEGLFKKTYVDLDEFRRMLPPASEKVPFISLTEGEAFLHPRLADILDICKSVHPEATLDLVTNGSIPPKGEKRRAMSLIDSLGISIDGATKKTYETIRKGGNFERFLANVKEIVAIRNECGKPGVMEFSFTAMTTNIKELSGVVRIAAEFGIPNVYFQPMEMREAEIVARIGPFHLSNMPTEEVYQATEAAISLGSRLGVSVYGASSMTRPAVGGVQAEQAQSGVSSVEAVRTCQFFWQKPFQYVRSDGQYHVLPCCYMLKSDAYTLSERYGLRFPVPEDVSTVYNSLEYWQMRADLAEGKLDSVCGGCAQAQTFPWADE
jgi:MoaA/NifB/PqqE/SkfB family radical SAM enzyme